MANNCDLGTASGLRYGYRGCGGDADGLVGMIPEGWQDDVVVIDEAACEVLFACAESGYTAEEAGAAMEALEL